VFLSIKLPKFHHTPSFLSNKTTELINLLSKINFTTLSLKLCPEFQLNRSTSRKINSIFQPVFNSIPMNTFLNDVPILPYDNWLKKKSNVSLVQHSVMSSVILYPSKQIIQCFNMNLLFWTHQHISNTTRGKTLSQTIFIIHWNYHEHSSTSCYYLQQRIIHTVVIYSQG